MTEAVGHDAMAEAEDRRMERRSKQAETLAMIATPRSLEALQRINKAAESGLLTEADLLLLDQIAQRITQQAVPNKSSR